jgi:hypothetical protein
MAFAGQDKFTLSGENLDDGRLGGCVFGELLAFRKAKKHHPLSGGTQQRPAHYAVWCELGFRG